MKTIAIMNYSKGSIVIHVIPNKEVCFDAESYIVDVLGYNLSEVEWMITDYFINITIETER